MNKILQKNIFTRFVSQKNPLIEVCIFQWLVVITVKLNFFTLGLSLKLQNWTNNWIYAAKNVNIESQLWNHKLETNIAYENLPFGQCVDANHG